MARKVMYNIRFSDEFLEYIEKEHNYVEYFRYCRPDVRERICASDYILFHANDPETRTNANIIKFVEEFGAKKAGCDLVVVPPYYNYEIVGEYSDEGEYINITFPWEQLARAFLTHDVNDVVRKAVESGELRVPNPGERYADDAADADDAAEIFA